VLFSRVLGALDQGLWLEAPRAVNRKRHYHREHRGRTEDTVNPKGKNPEGISDLRTTSVVSVVMLL
jgi:hypothetical protein